MRRNKCIVAGRWQSTTIQEQLHAELDLLQFGGNSSESRFGQNKKRKHLILISELGWHYSAVSSTTTSCCSTYWTKDGCSPVRYPVTIISHWTCVNVFLRCYEDMQHALKSGKVSNCIFWISKGWETTVPERFESKWKLHSQLIC